MKLEASFTERNELAGIRVGDAVFATSGGDLWTAVFSAASDVTRQAGLRAGDASSFSRADSATRTVLRWRGIPLGGGEVRAEVAIEKRSDGSQAWSLSFPLVPTGWLLSETSFPRLGRVLRDGEGDALLPAGDHGACLHKGRRARPEAEVVPYPAFTAMVSAFFAGENGLYVAAEDPDARLKSFRIEGEQNVSFETPIEDGAASPLYPVVLAPLRGDWWEAARRYRAFALKQKWASRGPIRDNPSYPRRLCQIPLWINIHAHPAEAEKIRLRVKEVFPDFPTGIHWHLWQHSGHDENYPEYFPAQPGTAEAISRAKADGQEMLPYANGRLWTTSTGGYEVARPFATLNYDGTRRAEIYHPATPPLAAMCPCCEPWQRVVRRFTGRILDELGAGSLFLDQVGSAYAVECHDPAHNHPTGGGAWWVDGYRRMLEPVRRDANARGAFLVTKGSGEYCMDFIDGYMQLTDRTPKDLPFWKAVYTGYTSFFGSPENVADDDTSFRALQTHDLFWGNALGWFLPEVMDHPAKCDILRALCAFRQKNLDALAYGTLLDELRFADPVAPVRTKWLSRRPNFQLFDKTMKLPPALEGEMPSVFGTWWRTADGKTVLLVSNLSDEERTVKCRPCCTPFAVGGRTTASGRQQEAFFLRLAPHELRRVEP